MLKTLALACLVGAIFFASGCGKRAETEISNPLPTPMSSSEAPNGDDALMQARLAELTQVVRRYAAEQRKVPASLDELVASKYLAVLPNAPAGKRFSIDKNLKVYLADL